jgi:hypothetical protein
MPDSKSESLATLDQFARLDTQRRERTGIPEAIFAEGKTPEQVSHMLDVLTEKAGFALATRVSEMCAEHINDHLSSKFFVTHNRTGRTVVTMRKNYEPKSTGGKVAILAAGTSDLSVAEEARVTAEVMGCEVFTFYDVGVAGIHRLVKPVETILQKDISSAVVVAGMEGALPSVVRGLVPIPVIGVPSSVGYGYGGKGEAALMSMLQSCSPGLTVVNIDNGFGAGATAALVANQVAAAKMK